MVFVDYSILFKLFLAVLLGGLVGFERERRNRAAGLRTNILVCIGATLVTVSSLMFGPNADPSRIAGQIIVGIGFIGAGVIMKSEQSGGVRGLTTAASLWVVATIGLAIGIGFYFGAILTAILVFLTLEISSWLKIKSKVRKSPILKEDMPKFNKKILKINELPKDS